jgi:hypothetical protein
VESNCKLRERESESREREPITQGWYSDGDKGRKKKRFSTSTDGNGVELGHKEECGLNNGKAALVTVRSKCWKIRK